MMSILKWKVNALSDTSYGPHLPIKVVDLEKLIQVHRDSERQLHFDSKFEHEEMVLVA